MPLHTRNNTNNVLTPCERFRILRLLRYNLPDFFMFLKRIPGYRKLDKHYGYDPKLYIHAMHTYESLISNLTGGKLSKPNYELQFLLDEINDYYCDGCQYREEANANQDR